jgi:hypothetical protein
LGEGDKKGNSYTIQLFQVVLDPGACPGLDPGFAGVTLQKTFYEIINRLKEA